MNIIIPAPNSSIAFYLFNFPLRFYGLLMAISFFVGIGVVYFLLFKKYNKFNCEIFLDYSPYLIVLSIIGARLFYILGSLDFYLKYPKEIFLINHGGLSLYGAIFFGIIGLYFLSKIKKFDFWEHIDALAVAFPICQSIGRFGNYFNQEAYGLPTNSFLKLYVSKSHRIDEFINVDFYHPAFLYESVLDLILFVVLFTIFFKFKNIKKGTIASIYLILYGIIRLFVENIRIDSVLNIGAIPIASIISIIAIILSLIWLYLIYKK